MSGRGAPSNKGGGILRSRKQKNNDGANEGAEEVGRPSGRGVTFSAKRDDDDGNTDNGGRIQSTRTPTTTATTTTTINAANNGGYDSDEVEDAIMASGDSLSIGRDPKTIKGNSDDVDMDDAAVRTSAEIEEAKRRRGRVRRREDGVETAEKYFDGDDTDDGRDGTTDDQGLSLITDRSADPDAYESNAAENAECPVEPFNMDAEREGGMGAFDGDTYVFRQNDKPVDGEDDAWLDGVTGDEEGNKGEGGGGLDSTSIWKPSEKNKGGERQKRKAKFVNEDAIPEDLGRRLVTLLQKDDETAMVALTRHGASMRELRAQEQKMTKKTKLKKRKSSKNKKVDVVDSKAPGASDTDKEAKQLKIKIEQTRETVEEISELADALLFGGEAEAYELTRRDWIHKFKLEQYFPSSPVQQRKRPPEGAAGVGDVQAKKKSRGYFDPNGGDNSDRVAEDAKKPQHAEVIMWEYKGNEDGAVHGPYTSQQMLQWTSAGFFVGESAVDIRRVGGTNNSNPSTTGENGKQKSEENANNKADDVEDLMADLMDDDDEEKLETKEEKPEDIAELSWMRSDRVDFGLYL